MRLRDFIREHRQELNDCINDAVRTVPMTASCLCPMSGTYHKCGPVKKYSTEEIREWIMNDEGLCRWARSEGCRI